MALKKNKAKKVERPKMCERKNIYYSLGRVRTAKLVKMYFTFQPATSVLALELSGRTRRQGPLGYVELTIKVIGK